MQATRLTYFVCSRHRWVVLAAKNRRALEFEGRHLTESFHTETKDRARLSSAVRLDDREPPPEWKESFSVSESEADLVKDTSE